jgi:hypothetical protein
MDAIDLLVAYVVAYVKLRGDAKRRFFAFKTFIDPERNLADISEPKNKLLRRSGLTLILFSC